VASTIEVHARVKYGLSRRIECEGADGRHAQHDRYSLSPFLSLPFLSRGG